MATLTQIKKWVQAGESDSLEFKTSLTQLDSACESLCGFLNHQGGMVLLGVSDKGELVGQMVSDKTRQEISHKLSKFEPHVRIEVKYIPLRNKNLVIMLKAGQGEHRPYMWGGRAFERVETTTRRMPQSRYDQLAAKRAQLNHSWETFIPGDYTLEDLDEELITGIIRKAVEIKRLPETALRHPVASVLEKLELLEEGQVRNAAMVLFGKKLFPDYPQCQLKVARFKGNTRQEFLDSNLYYGNLFELYEEAMQFVRRYLPVAAKIVEGRAERVETPLIPFNAIREAMLNALCHKDYQDRGGSIGLAIYDQFLEIFNDGGLLPGVTLERIKHGVSKLRNPLIATVLYKGDLIEKWGRGIQEIIRQCIDAGVPEPEFIVDEFMFKIIFKFPRTLSTVLPPEENDQKNLTLRQLEIIEILRTTQALKSSEIMFKLKKKPAERTLRDDLATLKKQGIVRSQGHARTAIWFLVKQ